MDISTMLHDGIEHQVTGHPNQLPSAVTNQLGLYGLRILSWQLSSGGTVNTSRSPDRRIRFYSLCQLIDGDGWYADPAGLMPQIPHGSTILICPDDPFGYGGIDKGFIEDFITFTGSVADQMRSAGMIRTGIHPSLNLRKIKDIVDVAVIPEAASQLKANALLQILLLDLGQMETRDSNPLWVRIRRLLREIAEQPEKWWTVSALATYCGVSEVHFRRVFKELTGTSPKRYLERIKMGVAAKILCQSDTSIIELAQHLDYHDPYHFSRRFKIVTGLSPEHYRKNTASQASESR